MTKQPAETSWPQSCPLTGEDHFISICCGNTNIRWALHTSLSKYHTQSNLQPTLIWKT